MPQIIRSVVKLLFICIAVAHPCVVVAQEADSILSTAEMKRLSIEQLMSVEVVSVSKWKDKLGTTASAVQIITAEELRRSGATSIPEALRLADNLHVAQKNSHDWAISARGFNTDLANKLLVLIDGRTVYTPLFSGVFWDRQDYLLADIDHIEIISGPGGTLWGSNAVNGVINIITKKSSETRGLYAEAGGGSWLRSFAGLRWGTQLGNNTALRVYGKYFDRAESMYPNEQEASDAWHMAQGGFRFDSRMSDKDLITVHGDYYNGQEDISTGGVSDAIGGNLMANWTHTFSDRSDLSVLTYYDRTKLKNPVPPLETDGTELAPAGTLKDDLHTYNIDIQHRIRLREHNRFIWGLGYRYMHDVVSNAPALAFEPETLDRNLFNIFAQDEMRLASGVYFTIGTKVEHNDYTGFEFEPSARLQFNVSEEETLWVSASRAVRIPSRIDAHVRLPTPAFSPIVDNLLVGNEDFISETVLAYELGLRSQVSSLLSGSAVVFYNVYDHVRSTSSSPPPAVFGLPLFYENNLEGETYGAELSVTCQAMSWWQLHLGYTLLKSDVRVKDGRTDFNNALNETADPESRVSIRSSMNVGRQFELDLNFRWVDRFTYNNSGTPGRVADYSELQARLGWHVSPSFELSVVGQNLLHDQHLEYVISSPNPTTEIQRSIYGKLVFVLK